MRGPILKNREYRMLVLAFILLLAAFGAGLLLNNHLAWKRVNSQLVSKNLSIIGSLVQKHPELENEIVTAFTKGVGNESLPLGIAAAKKYGYSEKSPISITPVLMDSYSMTSLSISLIILAQLLAAVLLIYFTFNRFYTRLNKLTYGADRIMRGFFDERFPDEGEGELPLLAFQFNQMSKRLQLTLEALQKEKELLKNMISDISHQLKTPLASVKMFNELLQGAAADKPDIRKEFLEKIESQIDRMEWLIQSLLKLSRLEAGAIEFKCTGNDLKETVRTALEALTARLNDKKQLIKVNLGTEEVNLPHDRDWMCEALENIIKNSIDYTPEEGEIQVSLQSNESTMSLTVKDSGPGIPEEELPNIFKRFYRGKNCSEANPQGSGIGLALAKLIIEKHDGIIQASSSRNQGTSFTIIFPRYPDNLTEL